MRTVHLVLIQSFLFFFFFFIISLFYCPWVKNVVSNYISMRSRSLQIHIRYLSSNFFTRYFQYFQLSKAESIEKSVIRIVNFELKCDFLWNFEPIVFDAHLTLNPIKANHWLTTFFYCLNLPLLMYISSYMSVGWWLFNMPVRFTYMEKSSTDFHSVRKHRQIDTL